MSDLRALESESLFILREAFARIDRPALLWGSDRESHVLLWLARKAFFGRIPFPVILLDAGLDFPEVQAYRSRLARDWRLDLIVQPCRPVDFLDTTRSPVVSAAVHKADGLLALLNREKYQGIIVPVRRGRMPDEWELVRSFRPPVHVYPIRLWGADDVRRYTPDHESRHGCTGRPV